MHNILSKIIVVLGLCLSIKTVRGQDFIRIGVARDFKSGTVQTFTIDLNRTEKVDEKEGKYIIFNRKGLYVLPSADVNLGEKISSAENNVLLQFRIGHVNLGNPVKDTNKGTVKVFNYGYEFNPTYNADKSFREKLYYGNFKYLFTHIASKSNENKADPYVKYGSAFVIGPFANLGSRSSLTFDDHRLYMTTGIITELIWNKFKKGDKEEDEPFTNIQFKVNGSYYRVISDIEALYSDGWAGNIKISASKNVFTKALFISLVYKYGNENPTYNYVHTLELGLKVNLIKS